jgi:hypothetical protein
MGILYLVQPCILIKTNRYKIGRSSQSNLTRVKSYGNGTRYLSILECEDDAIVEKQLISKFNKHFKLIGGNEFFEGDENEMLNLFITTVMNYKNNKTIDDVVDNNIVDNNIDELQKNIDKIDISWMSKFKFTQLT